MLHLSLLRAAAAGSDDLHAVGRGKLPREVAVLDVQAEPVEGRGEQVRLALQLALVLMTLRPMATRLLRVVSTEVQLDERAQQELGLLGVPQRRAELGDLGAAGATV